MLAEKGAFVKDILLQEFVKGLDALGLATLDYLTTVATTNVPLVSTISFSRMTNEDKINLRTLRRLLFLLSGSQRSEDSKVVIREDSPYENLQMNLAEASLLFNQLGSIQEVLPILCHSRALIGITTAVTESAC